MTNHRAELQAECDKRELNAPRITQNHVDSCITDEQYHQFPGTTVTICLLTLRNGFTCIGDSACASPENFDPRIGADLARKDAANKIWKLEGYLLKERLHQWVAQGHDKLTDMDFYN
ncbi:MAG: hypothetical protein RI964_837 [Pseudomonadota bacterium]|jgi:hypothetical protein